MDTPLVKRDTEILSGALCFTGTRVPVKNLLSKTSPASRASEPWPCWRPRASGWLPMRLLLDECVPARLRRALPAHAVSTVVMQGWSGVQNGALLALAAREFDAFITVDKNLPYQQNASQLPVAVVVLDAVSNELMHLLPLVPALEVVLATLQPRSYQCVRSEP
jgi:predicted nuclease of predicted toxin-antitoxin system